MTLTLTHQNSQFSVGDTISVYQRIHDGEKERVQVFEGMVIAIKGREENKSFTVRRIGIQNVGIERIFMFASPNLEKVTVTKKGLAGVRHAKLYYVRSKSAKEIEKIYSRALVRNEGKRGSKVKKAKAKVN